MSAVVAQRVSKVFGRRKALDRISFELPEGAFLSIFGPNGAGKSTLLRVLSTLARSTEGTVRVAGIDAKEHPDQVRERIGLISHQSMLYADLTAFENLMFAARMHGVVDTEDRVRAMLKAVELDHRRYDAVRTFSRGMTQRLSIARALLHDPSVVFLDEPYAGLDPHAVDIFDDLIDRMRAGRSFVMVSHDLQKGFDAATHVLVLAKGRTVLFQEKESVDFQEFSQLYRETVGMGVA